MVKRGLVSAYTCKKYRVHSSKSNEAAIPNLLDRDFNNQAPGACVVSDLTYVRVGTRWAYVCILLELGAREIIGQSAGANKNAELVHKAFSTVKGNLFDIQMFHTDRVYSKFFGLDFGSGLQVYYLIAVYCFVCTAAMFAFTGTPLGRMLNAVRDNPERVEFVGYNTQRVRSMGSIKGCATL